MLKLVSLALVLYSYFLIQASLPKLPRLIPTHFNAAGEPNGWGSPGSLWILLGVQVLTCVVILSVPYLGRRFPETVSLGLRRLSDYTPAQRVRILPLLDDMMGYVSILMNLFFVFMLRGTLRAAEQAHPQLHIRWPLALLLGGTLFLVIYHLRRFSQVAKEENAS